MKWYLKPLKNYASFQGRSRRKEFWMFALFNGIIMTVLYMIGGALLASAMQSGGSPVPSYVFFGLAAVYMLAILIPNISVTVRRLHDIGKGGGWWFIQFVPMIGGIWFLILMVTGSQPEENQFGAVPGDA